MSNPEKKLSLVVPCHNEAQAVSAFYARVLRVSEDLPGLDIEFLFVDDGSTDSTEAALRSLAKEDARVRAIFLSRNFGHQRAISAGLEHCTGDYIVIMDADLQDPPELLPQIVQQLDAGYDLVHTVRSDRRVDPMLKRWSAWFFYAIMKRWVLPELPVNAGDFKGFNRKVLSALLEYRESVRFLRGAFATIGFKQCTLPFVREARHSGQSKYPTWSMMRFARDAIVSNTVLPLRISFFLGLLTLLILPIYMAWAVYGYMQGAQRDPLLLIMLGMTQLFSGAILIMLGVLGEYIKVLVLESKHRPLYIVRDTVGVDERVG